MFSAQNTLLELYSEVGRKLQVKVIFKKGLVRTNIKEDAPV